MKIKTPELTGAALDWAVAKCEGVYFENLREFEDYALNYCTDWEHGGPLIEREEIGIKRNAPCSDGRQWEASGSITAKGAGYQFAYGPTPLIAAMRCYVVSKLGDTVDIPEELR
jgi:hypothetical protein